MATPSTISSKTASVSSSTPALSSRIKRVFYMPSEGNNLLHEVDGEGKCKKEKKCSDDGMSKNGEEKKIKAERKNKKKRKAPQGPPIGGYVHVRARRGQATDSHSLAERLRREKISERMRLLQSLVPGCDKMTGKALILEEIINYVQCLQNQVQFLVMKLADAYPMFNYLDTNTPASEVLLGIGEIIASRSCPKVLLLNGIHDRETSGFSAACFVTAIADALNRTCGDPDNCLKNHVSLKCFLAWRPTILQCNGRTGRVCVS